MIPISTDAPIYHYPIATGVVMAINVLFFIAFCSSPHEGDIEFIDAKGRVFHDELEIEETFDRINARDPVEAQQFVNSIRRVRIGASLNYYLALELGTIKPWQWLTSNFLHFNIIFVLFNLVFLWAFGMIVEGKVGPFVFLLLYCGVGTLYGMILQVGTYLFASPELVCGADAAIFGLLALCVIWAPANEFEVAWRFGLFDITILMYGFFMFIKEFLFFAIGGFTLSFEMLHLLGFCLALPIGMVMVWQGFVDCEGWDIFSYLHGKTGAESKVGREKMAEREKKKEKRETERDQKLGFIETPEVRTQSLQAQVTQAVEQGEFELAARLQARLSHSHPNLKWRQPDLYRVIQGLLKKSQFSEALPLITTHIEMFEEYRFPLQIVLIRLWLQQNRPRHAIKYMQGMNAAFLDEAQKSQLQQLAHYAKQQIASGVVEVNSQ